MFKRIVVLREGPARAKQGSLLAERIARGSGGTIILPLERTITPSTGTSRLPVPWRREREATQAPESDLLLIAGPGYAGVEIWKLEHVAQRASSYPPVPVLLLRAGAPVLSRTLLTRTRPPRPTMTAVALDGSREAEAALVPAAHLTAALTAPAEGALHLTRVVLHPDVEALLQDRGRIDPNTRDQIMREAIDYLHQMTNELRASLEELGLTITWLIALDSDVVNALVETAEQGHVVGGTCLFGGCDLLALATHSRDAKGYWIPGNVTGRLFTSTNLPLFLV